VMMREGFGSIFDSDGEWVCIPTNGKIYDNNGYAVMGAGVALTARKRYPGIDRVLGFLLKTKGNHVHLLGCWEDRLVFSMPTKDHFKDGSPLDLVLQSCTELRALYFACHRQPRAVLLPHIGCGHGGLVWEEIRDQVGAIMQESAFVFLSPGPTLRKG